MGGLAGGLTLHACAQPTTTSSTASSAASTAAAQPVSAATGSTLWIGYTPLYIAIEKGFFKDNGFDLEYKVFGSSSEGDAAFAAGQIEGLNNVTSETVALMSKGKNFRIVQVADTSLGGDGILARNTIPDVAGFKGKDIAVDVGGVSHFFLLQVLEEAGLTANDVKITNLTPDAAAAAYQAGKVDIAVTYSPFLQKANEAQPNGRIIYDTSKMPTAIVDVYLFNADFVAQHPEAMQAFVNGIYQAQDFLKTNKDEALAIAGKKLQLQPEEVEAELKGVDLTSAETNMKMLAEPDSDIYLVKHMDALGTFLKDQNQIPDAPSTDALSQLIEPAFVKAASI
jgi:NitT/TauT family transport system substrate-binding protein